MKMKKVPALFCVQRNFSNIQMKICDQTILGGRDLNPSTDCYNFIAVPNDAHPP